MLTANTSGAQVKLTCGSWKLIKPKRRPAEPTDFGGSWYILLNECYGEVIDEETLGDHQLVHYCRLSLFTRLHYGLGLVGCKEHKLGQNYTILTGYLLRSVARDK